MDRIDPADGNLLLISVRSTCTTVIGVLQDDLTRRISETHAKGVLIDISALEVVDSFIGRMIGNIAAMARILDASVVVVGMRPAVAIPLVELGITLAGVRTALDLEKGIDMLRVAARDQGWEGHQDG